MAGAGIQSADGNSRGQLITLQYLNRNMIVTLMLRTPHLGHIVGSRRNLDEYSRYNVLWTLNHVQLFHLRAFIYLCNSLVLRVAY